MDKTACEALGQIHQGGGIRPDRIVIRGAFARLASQLDMTVIRTGAFLSEVCGRQLPGWCTPAAVSCGSTWPCCLRRSAACVRAAGLA